MPDYIEAEGSAKLGAILSLASETARDGFLLMGRGAVLVKANLPTPSSEYTTVDGIRRHFADFYYPLSELIGNYEPETEGIIVIAGADTEYADFDVCYGLFRLVDEDGGSGLVM